jgi:hypothetical protein
MEPHRARWLYEEESGESFDATAVSKVDDLFHG